MTRRTRAVIDHWELGDFFGVRVVRGWAGGERVTAQLRWWSHGRFGVTRSERWTDGKYKVGCPAPTAFDGLR